jgi:hypothetical protein
MEKDMLKLLETDKESFLIETEKFLLELICYLASKSSMNVNSVTIDKIEYADQNALQGLYRQMVINGFDKDKKGNAMRSNQFCFHGTYENALELTFLQMCIIIANCIWNYENTKFEQYHHIFFPKYLMDDRSPIIFLHDVIMSIRGVGSYDSNPYYCIGQGPDGNPIIGYDIVPLFKVVKLSGTPKFSSLPQTIKDKFETVVLESEKPKLSLLHNWLSRSPSPRERRITNALLIFFCIICPTALFLTTLNGMIHVAPIFILPHLDFIANLFVGIAAEVFTGFFAAIITLRIVRSDEDQNELFEHGRSDSWKAFGFRVIGAYARERNDLDEHLADQSVEQ